MNNIYALLRRAKFSLHILFMVSLIAALYFVSMLLRSSEQLNSVSKQSSQTIFTNVLQKERNDLGKLTKDYAFWNEAVEKLILHPQHRFVEDNFLGSYMAETFSVSRVAVLNTDLKVSLSVLDGKVETQPSQTLSGPELLFLAKQALVSKLTDPSPVTGFIHLDGQLQLVSAVAITPNSSHDDLKFGHAYGVLIMTKQLLPMIQRIAQRFQFSTIEMVSPGQLMADDRCTYVVTSVLGNPLAQIVWQADMPGTLFWHHALPGLVTVLVVLVTACFLFWRQISHYFRLTLQSANELEKSHQRLNELAYFDVITKLPNRSLGIDRLRQALKSGKRTHLVTAVVFIDLDGFKQINDRYGHIVGDQVLEKVAYKIASSVRVEDTVARFGGDEFIVVLVGLQRAEDADVVVRKIWEVFNETFFVADDETKLTASIGVAVAPRDGTDPEVLIHKADHAMYQTKHSGKNNYGYYVTDVSAS